MSVISLLRAAGFEVYTRGEWGTARPGAYEARKATHPMPDGPAPYHFLHITVTADTDTKAEGFTGARKVESYGLSTPPMVSYQMLVTNEGRAFEGQNYGVKGTHTINDKDVPGFPHDLNRYGYACAIMQNIGDEVTAVEARLIAAVFAAAELEGWVKRGAPIYPHRKFAWKDCPGDKAVSWLPKIAEMKDAFVRAGMPAATNEGDDMEFSTIVPGQTYSVGTALVRGAEAQEAINEGGRTDHRIDVLNDLVAQQRREIDRLKQLVGDGS